MRWRCRCGYTLGDGREKLLAQCPEAKKTHFQRSKGAVGSRKEAQAAAVAKEKRPKVRKDLFDI